MRIARKRQAYTSGGRRIPDFTRQTTKHVQIELNRASSIHVYSPSAWNGYGQDNEVIAHLKPEKTPFAHDDMV